MYKLKLLIVCLLLSSKSISQIATPKDSVVVLTKNQAKATIIDLVRYDFSKSIIKEQELRIKNYQNKEIEFKNSLSIKDSIIFYQKSIIDIHKEVIKNKKVFEIHGYAGVQSIKLTLKEPVIYTSLIFEFSKFNAGLNYYLQANNPSSYGITIEYKLF